MAFHRSLEHNTIIQRDGSVHDGLSFGGEVDEAEDGAVVDGQARQALQITLVIRDVGCFVGIDGIQWDGEAMRGVPKEEIGLVADLLPLCSLGDGFGEDCFAVIVVVCDEAVDFWESV